MDDGTAQLHVARTVQYAVRTRRVVHGSSVCQDVCSTTVQTSHTVDHGLTMEGLVHQVEHAGPGHHP